MNESEDRGVDGNIDEVLNEQALEIQKALQVRSGKKIPEDEIIEILRGPLQTAMVTVQRRSFSGPIPSPDILDAYERIFPGAAEQIFARMKNEQDHRHQWENRALEVTHEEGKRRDIGAYMVVGAGLVVALALGWLGDTTAAAYLAGIIILGGGALVLGRQFFASHNDEGTSVAINQAPDLPPDPVDKGSARKTSPRAQKR